jgi:SOS response associated peptidase (SRAP)
LGLSTAAKPRLSARHQCAQSEIAILARLAKGRVALSRSGNVLLRVDR